MKKATHSLLTMSKKVAVIGAGAAGLVALRHLLASKDVSYAVGFEQTGRVGGTWVYMEHSDRDTQNHNVHSSVYANLCTNLPKETMLFPDFPFRKELPSFVTHQDVLQYLEDYTEHYQLTPHIKLELLCAQFHHKVELVEPVLTETCTKWRLRTEDLSSDKPASCDHLFDAVMVCNGHYTQPAVPDLPGLSDFTGLMLHSHNYRHPEEFSGQRVVMLGASSSGMDISLDIAPHAKQVFLCHRKDRLKCPLPDNIQECVNISSVSGNSVALDDGTIIPDVDVLMFCTGYEYSFPFLSELHESGLTPTYLPLYKHLIHPRYPTLAFVGIPRKILPFPQFYFQVLYFLATLTGHIKLPSSEEMQREVDRELGSLLSQGKPGRYYHDLPEHQWQYNDYLARESDSPLLPRVVEKLYKVVHIDRTSNVVHYKKKNYMVVDDDDFKVV